MQHEMPLNPLQYQYKHQGGLAPSLGYGSTTAFRVNGSGGDFHNHQPIDLRGASRSKHWNGSMTRTIAHYERLEQIGEGAYGQVYKARCKDNGRMVALKKLIIQHGGYNGMTPSVVREIKILQRLRHPRLVEMIEVVSSKGVEHLDEKDEHRTDYNKKKDSKNDNSSKSDSRIIDAREGYKGNLFLVLEYVSHDLMALLDIRYQFSAVQVKCIFKQLLEALKYMHEQKYVHRDLKPANILIDSYHRLKLADFGLARCIEPPILDNLHDRRSSLELTNKVVTVMYRPIEILLGATRYGYSVDMWSAGCILAELVLGKTLLPGKVEMDQIQLIFDLLGSPNTADGLNDLPLLRAGKIKIDKPKKSRLRDKYLNKMPPACLNLLEKLLELDPGKRLKAKLALESRYFKSEPLAPDFPEQLPPLQLGNGEADFHEFQTKKKRKEAKSLANAAKEEALERGVTEEEAESVFKEVYDGQMLRVQEEGIPALTTKEEVEKKEERRHRESDKYRDESRSKRARDEDRGRNRGDRTSDDRQSGDREKRRSRDRYDDEDRKRRRKDEDGPKRSDRRGDRDDLKKDESRRDVRRRSSGDDKRGDKRDEGRRDKRRSSESRREDKDGRRQKRREERRRSSIEKEKSEENGADNTETDTLARSSNKEKREPENGNADSKDDRNDEKPSRDSSRRRRERSRERSRERDGSRERFRDRSRDRKKSAHRDHDSDGHRRRDRDKDRERSRETRRREREWDGRYCEQQDREADRRNRDFPNAGPPPDWTGDRRGAFRDFPDGPRREPLRGPPGRDFPGGALPTRDHPGGSRREMESDRRGPPPPRDFPEGPYRDREGDRRGQRSRDFQDGPPFRDREGSRRGPPPRDFPGDDRRGPGPREFVDISPRDREGNRRGPPPPEREGDRRGPPPRDDDRRWNSRDSFDREDDRRGHQRDFHDRGPPPQDRRGTDIRREENFHGPGNTNRGGPPPGYRGRRFDDRPPPRREERRDRRR